MFEELKDKYKNDLILIAGNRNVHNIALDYDLPNVVNPAELLSRHPNMWPFPSCYKQQNIHRQNIEHIENYHPTNVAAIAIAHD